MLKILNFFGGAKKLFNLTSYLCQGQLLIAFYSLFSCLLVALKKPIPIDRDHPEHSETAEFATGADARPAPRGGGRQNGRSSKKRSSPRDHAVPNGSGERRFRGKASSGRGSNQRFNRSGNHGGRGR